MSPVLLAWLQLLVCAVLIAFAGTLLTRYGDVIADKTGLGGTWVGMVLIATVTSLPELVTGISSVALADTPEIAVGDILGACILNLALIVVLDALHRGESVYARASQGHILAAGFGIILLGLVGFSVLFARHDGIPTIGHVGMVSLVITGVYAAAMVTVFRYERSRQAAFVAREAARYPDVTLRYAVQRYAAAALVVAGAGTALPYVGEELARVMGWHETFVGTSFIALATTLPEIVVTVTALRLGALDIAIGNLFGSNLFNVFILAVDDLFYLRGPLLANVSPLHAASALSAVMMSGIAIVGLFYRPRSRLFGTVGWASLMLLAIYVLNMVFLYLSSR